MLPFSLLIRMNSDSTLQLAEEIHVDSRGKAQMSSVGRVIAVPVGRPRRKSDLLFCGG